MAMACRASAACAWRSAPGGPQMARASSKTLHAAAAWLGFEASRGLCRGLSYHNAAALWLYRRVEMGYHAASRRHALAAFGADTALIWGSRSGAGRWENGQQEDLSMDHRLVSAPARPAACAFAVAAATAMLA